MADGEGGCRYPILAGRFIEDMGQVIGHSFLAEPEEMRDLAIASAVGNQLEHCCLALGQVGWKRWACQSGWVMRKSAQPTADTVGRFPHPQFLKQDQGAVQQIPRT